jgi:phosphatidate cytidylyltransferase
MLKTRVATAVVLLAVLLTVLFSRSFPLFALVVTIFFAAAIWESARLFNLKHAIVVALLCAIVFAALLFKADWSRTTLLFVLSAAVWIVRLIPLLAIGLPAVDGGHNRLLSALYGIALFGCFAAITIFFLHSPQYLLSVMAIVWVADIGAYFAGKAFGTHKLAPSISPGKSWEGAVGGWLAVLVIAAVTVVVPQMQDTFASHVYAKWGWTGFLIVMTILVGFSIVGDLFESQLKRRIGMKDSSNLLPGHGGVLDRCDALIPVLPLAVLFDAWIGR